MNKKLLTQAITLGLLVAAPYNVWAANVIGDVTIDGKVQAVTPEGTFNVGSADNKNVNITSKGDALNIDGAKHHAIINGQEINIDAKGKDVLSIWHGAQLNLGSEATDKITIKGEQRAGLLFIEAHGVVQAKEINITNTDGGAAIWIQNNTQEAEAPKDAASIKLIGDKINIKSNDAGIVAFSNGQVDIKGDLTLEGKSAIDVRGNSTTNINQDGKHSTVIKGDIVFETPSTPENGQGSGNLVNANVNVNLNGENSSWTGRAYKDVPSGDKHNIDTSLGSPGEHYGPVTGLNLAISNGAAWNMTDNSFINHLNVNNGGNVNVQDRVQEFNADKVTMNDSALNLQGSDIKVNLNELNGKNATVTTDSLTNKVEIKTDKMDNLTVQGNGAIADQIFQDKANADKLAGVVVGGADNAVLTDKVTTEEGVIGGAFEGTVDKDGHVVGGSQAQNTFNMGVSDMASVSLMAWRAENDDMNQRLGELRDSKEEHGIWTRMVKGESEYGAITNKYTKYELGYDEKLSTNEHWTVGAAISYTDGDSSFAKGSGENTHKGLSVYGSYLADDGSYVDLIAKYAKLEHEFDVLGGIGKGDYEANGYSVSAEYGKRFTKDNGFWLEPQVQLSYGKVGAVSYATANALAEQDGMDSLVGRVGFRMGKDFAQGNVYAKASYLYDFDGETSVTMRKGSLADTYGQDLGGGWWEVGVGTNVALSDASYLYLDVERTYGGEVETPWQWNVGLRYSF